jgi:hypothetical protein
MIQAMSGPDASDSERRRQARAGWKVAIRRLEDLDDDLSDVTTAAERIAMMWPLAQEAWRLAGRPIPACDRCHTPSRVFRSGEPRPDDVEA